MVYQSHAVGNKTGWIIAGVLVLAVVGIIVKMVFFPSPSSPTSATRESGFMDAVKVDPPITTVIGALPSGSGNAGDDYRAAFDEFKANRKAVEAFFDELGGSEQTEIDLSRGRLIPPANVLTALEKIGSHVAAGAGKEKFEYVFTHTDKKEFEVGYFYQGTFDLGRVRECMGVLAIYQFGKKQFDQAAQTQKDLLMLGWHMSNEGVRLHMTLAGFDIQIEALAGLMDVYYNWGPEHRGKLKPIEQYKDAVKNAKITYDDKLPIFKALSLEAGDIFNIIENHKDRAFRVQALLFLGRVRHESAGNRGDMRYTRKLIDRYMDGKDPYEAAAAKAGRDLTKEQWDVLGDRVNRMNAS